MSETVIEVKNLTKVYKLYDKPIDRLKEVLHPFRKRFHKDFFALNDISFNVYKGETIGIIGKNGSGKSTLLKIITGVLTPTSGEVVVKGRISSLLELGAGFNPELTGLENVFFYGTINGMPRSFMESNLEKILSFADIGDFIHQPVKTYSSGMFVRLAFAVAIQIDPDILIEDEALAVGDIFFQQKCFKRMEELRDRGTTILFVSHDMGSIRNFCSRVILLKNSVVELIDEPTKVIYEYYRVDTNLIKTEILPSEEKKNSDTNVDSNITTKEENKSLFKGIVQNENIQFVSFQILEKEEYKTNFQIGQTATFVLNFFAKKDISEIYCSIILKNKMDIVVFSGGSYNKQLPLNAKNDQELIFKMDIDLNLEAGQYTVEVSIGSPLKNTFNKGESLIELPKFAPLIIYFDYEKYIPNFYGICGLNYSIEQFVKI
ncbi:MAG TPA: ABC transporter ATP-binding protein [Leptospiraceae bacterium]|nr:ABC transporter ATP-binding protein [Leptospiraceae bacterium]